MFLCIASPRRVRAPRTWAGLRIHEPVEVDPCFLRGLPNRFLERRVQHMLLTDDAVAIVPHQISRGPKPEPGKLFTRLGPFALQRSRQFHARQTRFTIFRVQDPQPLEMRSQRFHKLGGIIVKRLLLPLPNCTASCNRSRSTSFTRSRNSSVNRNPAAYINSAIRRLLPSMASKSRMHPPTTRPWAPCAHTVSATNH